MSPGPLSAGILSPVRAASFIAAFPSIIMPSTGMFSPGRTTKMSPVLRISIGTFFSLPDSASRITAVFGVSCIKPFIASEVLPFEWASSIFPTVIRVKIIAVLSK